MKHIIESFFWGIIAALGALVIELVFFIGISVYNQSSEISFAIFFTIPQFIIVAACIEEILKYLVISKRVEMFSFEKSYIINALFVGLGFFGVEMGLISMSQKLPITQFLIEIAIIHIGTAGLMGYLVAIKNPKKITTFLSTVLIAVFFHAAYNLLVLKREYIQNYFIFAVLVFLVLLNIANFFRIKSKLAQEQ